MEGEDVENMVSGKELLRQRYVGNGDSEKKVETTISKKGKRSAAVSNEIFSAAGIAVAAVLTVTLILILGLHLFFQRVDN
jgi:hypothetical protein